MEGILPVKDTVSKQVYHYFVFVISNNKMLSEGFGITVKGKLFYLSFEVGRGVTRHIFPQYVKKINHLHCWHFSFVFLLNSGM